MRDNNHNFMVMKNENVHVHEMKYIATAYMFLFKESREYKPN